MHDDSDSTPDAGISVVVCTRDRADLLDGCLRCLFAQDYSRFEIIVIDNAPADEATANLCASLPVRYTREPRPGLGRARNTGIAVARHDVIAFIDDDTLPEPGWLRGLALAFEDPTVMAVTGRVEAAEVSTPAHRYFEIGCGGMSKGGIARTFHRSHMGAAQLVAVQAVGVGANMAFRRQALDMLGGFDPLLGAGTPARGAEDLDAFHRILSAGMLLRYEPSAVVLHRHRAELPALRQQLYDSGCGFGVYLIRLYRAGSPGRIAVLRYVLGEWFPWLFTRVVRSLVGLHALPPGLVWAQLRGALHAPSAYRAGR